VSLPTLIAACAAFAALAYVLYPLLAPGEAARRGEPAAVCPACGPRPEADARFCSNCGRRLRGGHADG
jgi:predicted amidophosphoribosyltransferase